MEVKNIFQGRPRRILESLFNTIIPKGGAFAAGARDYDMIRKAEDMLRLYDKTSRKAFLVLLYYIQYSSLFRYGKVFTKLSLEKACQFLENMENSRFFYRRSVILLLKALTIILFYDIDEAAEQIGYFHVREECQPANSFSAGGHYDKGV